GGKADDLMKIGVGAKLDVAEITDAGRAAVRFMLDPAQAVAAKAVHRSMTEMRAEAPIEPAEILQRMLSDIEPAEQYGAPAPHKLAVQAAHERVNERAGEIVARDLFERQMTRPLDQLPQVVDLVRRQMTADAVPAAKLGRRPGRREADQVVVDRI